jgi:hypothetical protein
MPDGQVRRIRRQEFLGTREDFPTKKLAMRELDARLGAINSPTYRARPTATFAEFAKRWEADVGSQLKPSTASNYRMHIRRHLIPFFGMDLVKDIGPEMVQRFVARQKSAPKTVRNLCITLQSMWRAARSQRYVAYDIFDGLVLPKARRTQRYFFAAEDVQKIISAAKEPFRTWCGLAAETGLRAGELCGLTLDGINLERGILQVRQSAWRGKLGDPKTNDSVRVVELSPQACCIWQGSSNHGIRTSGDCSSPLATERHGTRTCFSSGSSVHCFGRSELNCPAATGFMRSVMLTQP